MSQSQKKSTEQTTTRVNSSMSKTKTATSTKASKPKRLTLVELQKSLNALETRMKRADTLTRKSVKTLEEVVDTLDNKTRKENASQKSTLSRRITALSQQLDQNTASMRAEIKTSLADALASSQQSIIEVALTKALERLEENEATQTASIAKINRHLASLAKAVEDRIVKDQIAATEALHAVETRLSSRLDKIETDSAAALMTIGDKVTTLTNALDARQTRFDEIAAQKISEATAKTEAKLAEQTQTLETRLEDRLNKLESSQHEILMRPTGPDEEVTSNITSLTEQVEMLKSRLSTVDMNFAALQAQTEIMGQDLVKAQQELKDSLEKQSVNTGIVDAGEVETEISETPSSDQNIAETITTLTDVISEGPQNNPTPNVINFVPQAPQIAGDNPYATASADTFQAPDTHTTQPTGQYLQEFDPNTIGPDATARSLVPQEHYATQNDETYLLQMPTSFEAPLAPPAMNGGLDPQHSLAQVTDVNALPAGDPLIPYADPAYAETEEHVDAMRIGGETPSKKRRKKTKKVKSKDGRKATIFTGRNLRVAALATGVTLVGLIAARTILFDDTLSVSNSTGNIPISEAFETEGENGAPEFEDPIGVYAETATPTISAAQANTLEAAVAAGDPVAEFQLGLSYVEQNRLEEGIALIRSAASTLPAAQYRLGKFYETGTGVDRDSALAKDLTERAARAGNRIAMHDLAIYYAYGNGGVDVDMGMAAGWFEKAAERDVVDSQFNLAILYENGQGVKPSPADAYFWYSVAASKGDQTASARLTALDSIMDPADISAAKTRVENFTPVKINEAANGIFRNLPWTRDAQRNAEIAKRNQIRDVQTLLTNLGFDVGAADGIMGRRTRTAITQFERVNGLAETGQVTPALIESLSAAANA